MEPRGLNALQRRLLNSPDGVIFDNGSASRRIVVVKTGSQIRLYFADPFAAYPVQPANIMSRIDLLRPQALLAVYTQAMMLGLIWNSRPRRALMLGFGGGRLPAVLGHYFPELTIDSTEIFSELEDVAKAFFGFKFGRRQRLFIADARTFMESLPAATRYDLILVDVFAGNGHSSPHETSTAEFYELCRRHLTGNGVVAVNLLSSDDHFRDKVGTLDRSFPHAHHFSADGADVLFGTEGEELTAEEILARADRLDRQHQFLFSLARRAAFVVPIRDRGLADFLVLRD